MGANGTSVAVVGGGVGGLSAAHELVERGFDVAVYEAGDRFGGKARSIPISDADRPLHGEHGFRFFPAFYRHVTATMARIPYRDRTVADNLVPTDETLLARTAGEERTSSTRTPTSIRGWLDSLRPPVAAELDRAELRFFTERLLVLLTSCDRRREEQWDAVSWWDFIDADGRSDAYRRYLAGGTQPLVAIRPQLASARTVGLVYAQLVAGQLDPRQPAERVLNGPSSEVWIDPWVDSLAAAGADLHTNARATEVAADGRRVTGVTVETPAGRQTVEADHYVLAVPVEAVPSLLSPALERAAPSLAGVRDLETAWMNGIQFYLAEDVPLTGGHGIYVDSPWALTSISQQQFWSAFDVSARRPGVEGVLSVIVSDWETPGLDQEKPARECTREEIAAEVWTQLKAHLNRETERLTDDLLVDWFLDPAIVETGDGVENRAPLLVNTVGSLAHRPAAATEAPNLALAADYVRTNADLASMESANEAGRRAANAVIERSGATADPAAVWELPEPAVFEPLRRQDAIRYRLGLPHPGEVSRSLQAWVRDLRPGSPG
ncbi:MAG: FAD-dependent oxidoreductase [Haloarculaceae archaeon]